jgi:RHS repeat-associated protein
VVDPNNHRTTWEWDIQGRVTKKIRPNDSEWTYLYETATSRLESVTDPKDQVKTYSYFLDDNLESISYSNEEHDTANVNFTFDEAYSRLKTMTDGTGTTTYLYKPDGVLGALQPESVDGPLSNDTVTYAYDERGRVVSRSINGVPLTYEYDALGRIITENNVLGSFSYQYDDVTNRLSMVNYPNGQNSTYTYETYIGDHRLKEIHNKKSAGTTISKFDYSNDAVGNIESWVQQDDEDPPKAYDFEYDRADQLRSAVWRTTDATPTILGRYIYGYDPAGNRSVEQIDNAPVLSAYDNMNRLSSQSPGGTMRFAGTLNEAATVTIEGASATVTSDDRFAGGAQVGSGTTEVVVKAKDYSGNERTNTYEVSVSGSSKTFTFDANGNMTGDGTRTFEWDAENRLITYTEGDVSISFEYDGRGRRTRLTKVVDTSTVKDVRFLWCGDEICEERDNSGANVVRRFFEYGYWDTSGGHFFTRDHLRNVREVVDPAQIVADRYDYDSYGQVSVDFSSTDNPIRFTGHYLEETSGLVLTLYRAYDPALGQWLSEDPIEHRDGLSLYGYALGNPIRYYDSLGLFAQQPNGPPNCGGPCPHWVMTEYFNACDAEQDNPDPWISRCMREKCKWTGNVRKEVRITCGTRSTNSECANGQPGYTPLSDSIVICPENGNNAPCWRRVMVHEIVIHACRPGGPGVPPESHDRDLSPHIRRNVDCPVAGAQ